MMLIFSVGRLILPVIELAMKVERWMFPNRAADPGKETILLDTFPMIEHHWNGERAENWYLDALAVHPDSQGKGYGRELVQWGVDEAKREGVCASAISADGKEAFYAKFGFMEVGRSNIGPLSGLVGGAILFTVGT